MAKQTYDPGLGQQYNTRTDKKVINDNGTFNVKRVGKVSLFNDMYNYMVHLSWTHFIIVVLSFYLCVNLLFACIYYSIGVEHLSGADGSTPIKAYLSSFFFSAQTFTTVGYGGIAPRGLAASFTAAIEALVGLMSLAIITGVFYGRFSKPTARILFSRNALISPYRDGRALMFRIANKRKNELIEANVTVLMMTVDKAGEGYSRNYTSIALEVDTIKFFPLNWTLVHHINENSPLHGRENEFYEDHDVEFLILVKAFDDTFSQTVYSRYSYKWNDIVWGGKFIKPFYLDDDGIVVMELDKLHHYETVSLP